MMTMINNKKYISKYNNKYLTNVMKNILIIMVEILKILSCYVKFNIVKDQYSYNKINKDN